MRKKGKGEQKYSTKNNHIIITWSNLVTSLPAKFKEVNSLPKQAD